MNATSTQTLTPNHFLYNVASAICDPLNTDQGTIVKIARVALAAIAFYATLGIATILASAYVDIQDEKLLGIATILASAYVDIQDEKLLCSAKIPIQKPDEKNVTPPSSTTDWDEFHREMDHFRNTFNAEFNRPISELHV